jgi:hypothetical protein
MESLTPINSQGVGGLRATFDTPIGSLSSHLALSSRTIFDGTYALYELDDGGYVISYGRPYEGENAKFLSIHNTQQDAMDEFTRVKILRSNTFALKTDVDKVIKELENRISYLEGKVGLLTTTFKD